MIHLPNCKINLGLHIVARRSDGFHDIETVLYHTSLKDALEIVPATDGRFSFQTSGLTIAGGEDSNLCVRAFNLLQADFNLPPVKMHLHKCIPMGSGLGGGSSDGAHVLKMINELFALHLEDEQLMVYARRLGSDCAFFTGDRPQFAAERGDQLQPVDLDLSGWYLVIVVPDIHVDTARAYSMVTPVAPVHPLIDVIQLPVAEWKHKLVNDFEKPVFAAFPRIAEIKQKLYDAGAIYASMSGSGSAVYGLFTDIPEPGAHFPGCYVWSSICL